MVVVVLVVVELVLLVVVKVVTAVAGLVLWLGRGRHFSRRGFFSG